MLSENQNNVWKNRLDALDNLPGETFRSNAAWDKLNQRMQEKSSTKKPGWYWLAAACLLATIMLLLLLKSNKEISLAKKNSIQKQLNKIEHSPAPAFIANDNAALVNIFHFRKRHVKTFIVKHPETALPSTKILTAEKEVATEIIVPKNTLPEDVNIISADTFHQATAKIKSRPKLCVIHINELDQPAEETKFVRNERSFFPIRINGKDIFSAPSNQSNSDHSILKINLSRQN